MGYWSVAMTKSSSENIAKHHLERQDYKVYLPKFIFRNGKETKIKVLFPRYIFVFIELKWYSILGTRGVTKLLMKESTPAIVPDKIIENLMKREDSKGFISLDEPSKFKPGEKIRIANNSLFGYVGIYQGMKDRERARVLIEILGQSVPVDLQECDLEPITVR